VWLRRTRASPGRAEAAILEQHVPWGAQVDRQPRRHRPAVRNRRQRAGLRRRRRRRFATAWGNQPVEQGSVVRSRFIAEFAAASFLRRRILAAGWKTRRRRRIASTKACTWACSTCRYRRGALLATAALRRTGRAVAWRIVAGSAHVVFNCASADFDRLVVRRSPNGSRPETVCYTSSARRTRPMAVSTSRPD